MPDKHRKAIHPFAILKESWRVCRSNIVKLGAIYLIFNLPIALAYFTPMASKLQSQKPDVSTVILFFLPVFILSIWGHIALLLSAHKAVNLEDYSIGQSISQTKAVFLKYLGTVLIVSLFLMGVTLLGGISAAMVLAILLKVNKILAVLFFLVLVITVTVCLVYFMLRWSLATIICVLENIRPVAALKRSLSLVTDYVNPTVGTYCLITFIFIFSLIPIIFVGAFLGLGNNVDQANQVGTLYSMFINIVLVPLWTIITVILYKKLKEALETHVYA